MSDRRGVVVAPNVWLDDEQGSKVFSTELNENELRLWLLFWDILDYPVNNLVSLHSPVADYLISVGAMQRTALSARGAVFIDTDFIELSHAIAFQVLDNKEPGTWSLAQGRGLSAIHGDGHEEGRGVLVRLYQALPIPTRDVPLDQILEFKERRRPELLALRTYLEGVYQKVASSADGDLAIKTELVALDQAIRDHTVASQEAGMRLRLSDLTAQITVFDPVKAVAAGSVTTALGQGVTAALLAGLAAGFVPTVEIATALGLGRKREVGTPFKYITSLGREL